MCRSPMDLDCAVAHRRQASKLETNRSSNNEMNEQTVSKRSEEMTMATIMGTVETRASVMRPSYRMNRTNRAASKHGGRYWAASSSATLRRAIVAHLLPVLLLCSVVRANIGSSLSGSQYSQPVPSNVGDKDNESFRPIIPTGISPEYISRNVFTKTGQYRVFQSVESDLRATVALKRNAFENEIAIRPDEDKLPSGSGKTDIANDAINRVVMFAPSHGDKRMRGSSTPPPPNPPAPKDSTTLENLLMEYVEHFFGKGQYEPMPGLIFELQKNRTDGQIRVRRQVPSRRYSGVPQVNIGHRALQSGRLLSLAGLKKILWPVFTGFQILKSLLVAMLLPALVGSLQGLFAKGLLNSGQLSIRPMDSPIETTFNFDDDAKFTANTDVNQQAASQIQNQYAYNAGTINGQALSRYGMNEQQKMQDSYLSALQSISSGSFQTSTSLSGGSSAAMARPAIAAKPAAPANINTFQKFQNVPESSLLLSNYDPFYSPLLSRLDSVFAQLKLNSADEACREKLICLMYAYPAKYAPYSNLVSAQLSRELNELRKPTSDNPDILRFFRYMRAAKDGQDGIDCEKTFEKCTEFKDFENPAMVSTYNDINKLVQARKLT